MYIYIYIWNINTNKNVYIYIHIYLFIDLFIYLCIHFYVYLLIWGLASSGLGCTGASNLLGSTSSLGKIRGVEGSFGSALEFGVSLESENKVQGGLQPSSSLLQSLTFWA